MNQSFGNRSSTEIICMAVAKKRLCIKKIMISGFVQVLENMVSPGILLQLFPGLEIRGKRPLVLESSGYL